jgi:hypothetical protein
VHERFALLLNRLAIAPNIARSQHEDAVRRENGVVADQIDSGVHRAIVRLEKRVSDVEKELFTR